MKTHDRKLGLSGVSLTNARGNRNYVKALTIVRDTLEPLLVPSGYLINAPFSWVTIVVRYGLVDAGCPTYQAINKKYGDLPLSIEVDTRQLVGAALAELVSIFKRAVLIALIDAGKRYGVSTSTLEQYLAQMGSDTEVSPRITKVNFER